MTKQCRIMLRTMQAASKNEDTILRLQYNCFLIEDMTGAAEHIMIPDSIVREKKSILGQLINDCYVDMYSTGKYKLTHRGLHPYGVGWDRIKGFLFESIFVPIGVALVTTLLVNFFL